MRIVAARLRRHGTAWIVLLASAVGCHRPYTGEYAEPKESMDGVYAYSAIVDGGAVGGKFVIQGNFLALNVTNGTCLPTNDRREAFARTGGTVTRSCTAVNHEIVFTINLDNPMRGSTWRSTRSETRYRRICKRTVISRDGRETCAEYGQQAYEVSIGISGQLSVQLGEPR